MLTLKNISLKSYIDDGLRNNGRSEEHYLNAILLRKYGIYDCQTLLEYVKNGHPEFQKETFKRIIKRVTVNLRIANTKGLNPKRYTFEKYDKYSEMKSVLERADSLVSCSELPVFSPIRLSDGIQFRDNMSKLTIEDAKQHLGMLDTNLRNSLFTQYSYLRSRQIEEIVKGIKFYEDQIIRVALDTPNVLDYKGNLFDKDAKEKEDIIDSILEDIMLYLVREGEIFIWGRMGKKAKELLLSSLHLNTDIQWEIRDRFLNLIRNYVTLRELEDGVIENGTLKRFIVEPKK